MWLFPIKDPTIFQSSSQSNEIPNPEEEIPWGRQFIENFENIGSNADNSFIEREINRYS